ncbi:MAG: ATP-binding protein [Gammaproteobacteria bacterium]
MFDDSNELLDKIGLGEDSSLELKEVRFSGNRLTAPHRDGLADELVAFANARGGVCVLGVEDGSRKIIGIPEERLDRVEALVREVCNDSIDPPLYAHIERLRLPDAGGNRVPIIKIDVPRSLFVHRGPGGYLQRLGSSRRVLTSEQLARLFQQRSQTGLIRFDEQVVGTATLDDLKSALWQRFFDRPSQDSREIRLSKLGLARRDEAGVWRPTVSGVLVATEEPRDWLPNAFIQAVAYRGTTTVPEGPSDLYQLDAKDISGPADAQVIENCRFVLRNMRVAATKGPGRRDLPQFDMPAVFEAVVNAVAHRDYSIHGSKIHLRLFADRMELYSPGAPPNSLDIDSLPFRQAARNETLTSMLARCAIPEGLDWLKTDRQTLMDKRGEGVRIILDSGQRLSGRTPEYRLIGDAELLLTIYGASLS